MGPVAAVKHSCKKNKKNHKGAGRKSTTGESKTAMPTVYIVIQKFFLFFFPRTSPAALAPPCDSLERNNMAKHRLAAAGDGEKSDTTLSYPTLQSVLFINVSLRQRREVATFRGGQG